MKLLILSITAGQGHHQTGLAISEYFKKNGHFVTQLDCYEYLSPAIKEMVSGGYLVSTKYSPKFYGRMYRLAEKMDEADKQAKIFQISNSIFYKKMAKYLKEENPDVIICTHVFAAIMITFLAKKGIRYPTIGIITDFRVHPFWETTTLDYYVTPNEYMTPSLLKKGFRSEQILPFGIPIFEKFCTKITQEEARRALGFHQKPTILMMSGSMGYGNLEKLVKAVDSVAKEFQIVTVCGNNDKLKKKVDRMRLKHPIFNYGYINYVDKLMDAADCIVTKPGGLTVSESLAKELPMLISKPIPGQEDRNLEFLLNFGCCMRISKTSPIDELISQLFLNEKKRALMLENIRLLKKPDSVLDLYQHITKLQCEKGENEDDRNRK